MRIREKKRLAESFAAMSDADLARLYWEDFYAGLGSDAEAMEERGWDESDVADRRSYEKFVSDKNDLEYEVLLSRGIDPMKDFTKGKAEDKNEQHR